MRRALGVALEAAIANEDGSEAEYIAAGNRLVDLLNVLHAPEGEHLELVRRCSSMTQAARRVSRAKEQTAVAIFNVLEATHRDQIRKFKFAKETTT
jgi:hypothetical protein